MQVEHLAIDGAIVTLEADADLSSRATATGWAVVPALLRSHPFSVSPPGHSTIVEKGARRALGDRLEISNVQDLSLKGGKLRVAEIQVPAATGGKKAMAIGAWEGSTGCLSTSIARATASKVVEVFDTLQFSAGKAGVSIDSPVMPGPKAPQVVKEIPSMGVVSVKPAIASELERIPKARGFLTNAGELFRANATDETLLFVTRSAIATVHLATAEARDGFLAQAHSLRIEWRPRQRSARSL